MQPLEGVTVIEFSTMITASFAAMMMSEQGARVIKVEPLETGDPMRYLGTSKGGISALFANCNRGKSSIRLDLKQPSGLEIAHSLVRKADVLMHNFRPGVMDQLGLGSDSLRAANPRLVYTAVSGFGTDGPLGNAPAYDPVVQAHAGFTEMQGTDKPALVRSLICDKITAYTAFQAVTAALLLREKTGEGQHIDISMLDAGLFFLFPDGFMNNTLLDDDIEVRQHVADLSKLIATRDGAINISAGSENQMNGALRAIGREDLLGDPRFETVEARMQNVAAFLDIMAAGFAKMTSDEAVQRLRGNDVPCAKSHGFEEVIGQPQIEASQTVVVREHPLMGSMRIVKSPTRFNGEQSEPGDHSPTHGEHTDSLLREWGYSEDQIVELHRNLVIA